MKKMISVLFILSLLILSGCTGPVKAKKTVIDAGYQDVEIIGYDNSPFGSSCSVDSFDFFARKKDGTGVNGVVCSDQHHASWIHLVDNFCGDTVESATPSAFKVLAKLSEIKPTHFDEDAGNVQVTVDQSGTAYVANGIEHTILKITPTGLTTTLAGLAGVAGNVDGVGSQARFGDLTGIAVDDYGWVYVTEYREGVVRKISPAGKVSTLAGSITNYKDNDGVGALAGLSGVGDIVVDKQGNVYVTNYDQDTIRKITQNGNVSTFAGRPDSRNDYHDEKKGRALFLGPQSLAIDKNNGVLYVTEGGWVKFLHRIMPDGMVSTLVYTSTGVGWTAQRTNALEFTTDGTIAVDPKGNIYIASGDQGGLSIITTNGTIYAYPSAAITTHAGDGACSIIPTDITSMAISPRGVVATAAAYDKKGVYIAPLATDKTIAKSVKFNLLN